MKAVTKEVKTAFLWVLKKEGEMREIFLVDRFLFMTQRRVGKGQYILPMEWADDDYARGRAIEATMKAEVEGLRLDGPVLRYDVWRSDEDLTMICDDDDYLAVIKLIGLAQTHGIVLR